MRKQIVRAGLLLAAGVPALLPAAPSHVPGLPPDQRQHRCPVVTSELVSPRGPAVRYRGIKVYLSSQQAVNKWNRSPAAYIDTKTLPQLQDLTLPERPITQGYCPVYRTRKVSHFDPFVVHGGKKVYFYDELARRKWLENPAKYLDLELLPQLRGPEQSEVEATERELEGLLAEPAAPAQPAGAEAGAGSP
ncbi:MAG TPA: hypothetical protein VML55_01880 [Planctomycetaceae bacterium]|nr:hypothetical protein [Planctomycetaceae bacterium]